MDEKKKDPWVEPIVLKTLYENGDPESKYGQVSLRILCYSNKWNRLEKRMFSRNKNTGKDFSKLKTLDVEDCQIIVDRWDEIRSLLETPYVAPIVEQQDLPLGNEEQVDPTEQVDHAREVTLEQLHCEMIAKNAAEAKKTFDDDEEMPF